MLPRSGALPLAARVPPAHFSSSRRISARISGGSRLISRKRFFQVTSPLLLLFPTQIVIYALHALSEAGIVPASEAFHLATEPLSPDVPNGKWFSIVTPQ